MNEPSVKLTMYESIMVGYINGTISHEASRFLADWLGCREYVIPANRVSNTNLISYVIYHTETKTAKDLFNLWLLVDTIESSLTRESQERILSWMTE
jgi:hypothetical protein